MRSTGVAELRFTVLGPLQAWRGDDEVPLGSPQQRAVLATLLLRQGRPATVEELVDAVWDEDPPTGAVSVLRTYISRLRGVLEPDRKKDQAPSVLVSVANGYAVRVPDGAMDLTEFEHQVHEARELNTQGATRAARDLLRMALDCWKGVPLAGVPGAFADSERSRLAELRVCATETRVDLDLELGGHRDVVSELITLTAAHPLRERLRRQLMLALYRCDRQAEALAVYHDTRHTLIEQLGIEPGTALRELHGLVLAADPSLSAPPAEPGPRTSAVRPAQLPSDLADFTGREVETAELSAVLSDESGTAVPVAVLTGMGGAGKTTLAVHVAHKVSDDFPDGQLYVDLRGVDGTPACPAAVLGGFLRALGEKDQGMPDSLAERAALYRSILSRRRILVVVDNAHDSEQVRPLLPGSGRCAVIVTSRSRLAALPATGRVSVEVFQPQVAAALFARIVSGPRTDTERLAVLRVVELCGGLPLAVRILASRLAVRPEWSITDAVDQLKDERRLLGELRVESLAVEACFRLGYGQLDQEQARAFRLLALPAPNTLGLVDAAAVLNLPLERTEPLLESLVEVGMLESPTRRRYRYHDLLRLFARQRAQEEESTDTRAAALTRLLDSLVATARNAYRLIRPGHTTPASLVLTKHRGVTFADAEEACAWGARELSAALELVEQVAQTATAGAADLLLALDPLLMAEHRWHDVIPVARVVAAAARRAGDRRAERRVCYMLGGALMQVGDNGSAREVTSRAVDLSAGTSDQTVHAMALNVQGILQSHAGRGQDAVELGGRAVTIARGIGDRSVEALALGNIIQARLWLGESDQSLLNAAQQLVGLHESLDDQHGSIMALYRVGQVLRSLGRPAEALRRHQESLEILGADGQRFLQAGNLIRGAEACLDLDQPEAAARMAERGIMVSRELGFDRLEAMGALTLGDALIRMGHQSWARACWEQAHDICVRLEMTREAEELRDRLLAEPAHSH
ncbi:BTAD domain-containing putative transcriptional regulator [Streptomyces sp. NPDC023998]|uniref:AfsR/SARP family transcriptional regulator n=1 Tax=Streptomyces sp. NPDC023998 TaxID=3154597 RepID=UPI003400D8E9